MLHEQLRDEWRSREHTRPIYPTMTFGPEGLVLGAGTVILEGSRRLESLSFLGELDAGQVAELGA